MKIGRPPIPIAERLMNKTIKTETCWFWSGQKTHNGYGQFVYREGKNIKCTMAHRAIYQTFIGPINPGLTLDHLCENKSCVNPKHLEPVTIGENIRRAPRSISKTCMYGHLYKEQSAYYKSKGARRCHVCHAAKAAERRIASLLSVI